jgi:hypothetical protein
MASFRETLPRGDALKQQSVDVAFRRFSDNGSRLGSTMTGFNNSGNAVGIVNIQRSCLANR